MAVGGADRAPFDAAFRLTLWARPQLGYIGGRLRLAGIDPAGLCAADWLDLIYAEAVDQHAHAMIERVKVREALDEQLDKPVVPRRDTWGLDPTSQRQQRAMMDLAGGPAPMRDPARQRPRPVETAPP